MKTAFVIWDFRITKKTLNVSWLIFILSVGFYNSLIQAKNLHPVFLLKLQHSDGKGTGVDKNGTPSCVGGPIC